MQRFMILQSINTIRKILRKIFSNKRILKTEAKRSRSPEGLNTYSVSYHAGSDWIYRREQQWRLPKQLLGGPPYPGRVQCQILWDWAWIIWNLNNWEKCEREKNRIKCWFTTIKEIKAKIYCMFRYSNPQIFSLVLTLLVWLLCQ